MRGKKKVVSREERRLNSMQNQNQVIWVIMRWEKKTRYLSFLVRYAIVTFDFHDCQRYLKWSKGRKERMTYNDNKEEKSWVESVFYDETEERQ